jgi:hypothetical protein
MIQFPCFLYLSCHDIGHFLFSVQEPSPVVHTGTPGFCFHEGYIELEGIQHSFALQDLWNRRLLSDLPELFAAASLGIMNMTDIRPMSNSRGSTDRVFGGDWDDTDANADANTDAADAPDNGDDGDGDRGDCFGVAVMVTSKQCPTTAQLEASLSH